MTTEPSPAKRSRLNRIVRRVVRDGAIVYLALCGLAYFGQDWIAFPGTRFHGKPETVINFGRGIPVLQLHTATGIPIAAVFGSAKLPDGTDDPDAQHRPTVLFFYGNAGAIAWTQGEFDNFRRLGMNVLIPDLPGFGQSGGTASEKYFYAAADASWAYLMARTDVDPKKIIVVGWSMGGGIAVDLAGRKPVAALMTFNAFTTFGAMARQLLPWLPTTWLAKYQFDNLAKISSVHVPMLIVNGKLDTLVPPAMSDTLAAHAGGPVTRLTLESADHNTIFSAEPQTLWPAVATFVAGLK